MLTLNHLANLIALLLGERPETMQLIARNLREAGLVASGGRGRGGARQEPRHVANMLIGAIAADQVADVAGSVATCAGLEVTETPGRRTRLGEARERPKELLFATRKGVQFGGALSGLVEMAASGGLYSLLMAYSREFVDRDLLHAGADAIKRAPRGKKPEVTAAFAARMAAHVQALIDQSAVYLTIAVARPLPRAWIEFGISSGEKTPLLRADFGLPPAFAANSRNIQKLGAWAAMDRTHRVTISHRTLLSLGQAIAAEEER
jgi:hypothetical protein